MSSQKISLIPITLLGVGFLFYLKSRKPTPSMPKIKQKPLTINSTDEEIKKRLLDLGYFMAEDNLEYAVRLFQSIFAGNVTVKGDGVIGKETIQWLNATNAPKWCKIPLQGEGFINMDDDGYGYGTSWLIEVVQEAGRNFAFNDVTSIGLNDASTPEGGKNSDHQTHQTGLNLDIRLPHKNHEIGGISYKDSEYNREVMRSILEVFWDTEQVKSILFNDPQLIDEGLCVFSSGHDHHAHLTVRAQGRKNA